MQYLEKEMIFNTCSLPLSEVYASKSGYFVNKDFIEVYAFEYFFGNQGLNITVFRNINDD